MERVQRTRQRVQQQIKQMIKQAIKKMIKQAIKKMIMLIIKYLLILIGPEVLVILLIVILMGGIFGALAAGFYDDAGPANSKADQQTVQPYKDAVQHVNPTNDAADGVNNSNIDPYALDWGVLYAIDTLGDNLPMDAPKLTSHAQDMAEALKPIYQYEDETVRQMSNGNLTQTTQHLLKTVSTYIGVYTFSYKMETTKYKNGNDTYSLTQYVLSGVTFSEDHTRLIDSIKKFAHMKTVSESDLTMVLQLAKGINEQQANLDWMLTDNPTALGNNGAFIGEVPVSMLDAFKQAGLTYGISEYLLMAIAKKESTFNPKAVGPVCSDGQRAEGLMQFKPSTWKEEGIDGDHDGKADPFDAIDSIYSAANYLHTLLGIVGGDLHTAVKDYGEGTDAYADDVFAIAAAFQKQFEDSSNGKYLWPVQGTTFADISQVFGNPDGTPNGHDGLDIAAPTGRPIIAVVDGTIAQLGTPDTDRNGGNSIYLHGIDGNYWYFCHLSDFHVHVGEQVKAGQVIGYVGTTGNAKGPHLHFGLITNGSISGPWVDPLTKFKQ